MATVRLDWPGEVVNRRPVFGVGETKLRDHLQLVLSLSHELKTPLKLDEQWQNIFLNDGEWKYRHLDLVEYNTSIMSPAIICAFHRCALFTLRGNCWVTSGRYGTPALVLWSATTMKYSKSFLSCGSIRSLSKVRYRPVCLSMDWTDTRRWLCAEVERNAFHG